MLVYIPHGLQKTNKCVQYHYCKQNATISSNEILPTAYDGRGKRNSRSNRPGRRRAGSMASMRFVAPITTISPRLSRPSISASNVDTMELWIWSWRLERIGARPSISSKNMIDGRIWYACIYTQCHINTALNFEPFSIHTAVLLLSLNTHNHFTALWTLSGTTRVSWYQKVHFAIFWIFWYKTKITQADTPTIQMDCHPIQTNWCPHLCHPHHFYARCPSWHSPPNLSWLRTGTKYAGLHTQWLYYHEMH